MSSNTTTTSTTATTTSNGSSGGRRTVVLTGASSGIGKGTAQQLAKNGGFNLVLAARRTALIEELAKECGNAIAVTTDVSKLDQMTNLLQAAISQYGKVDIWINCAGIGAAGRFTDIPFEDHMKVIETTFMSAFYGTFTAMKYFEQQGSGNLINIASAVGKMAFPYFSTYSASKWGVVGLGKAIFRELQMSGNTNIHISTVCPWAVDTPWFNNAANYTGHTLRMPMPDDPQVIVDAIIKVIDNPQEEINPGITAEMALAGSHMMPGTSERMTANTALKYIFHDAPATEKTSGSLHTPAQDAGEVRGGMKERVAQEDAAKKSATTA